MKTYVTLYVHASSLETLDRVFDYIDTSFKAGVSSVFSLCHEDDRVTVDITVDPGQDESRLHWRLQTLMANLKHLGCECELHVMTRQKAADNLLYEGVEYNGTYLYGYRQ